MNNERTIYRSRDDKVIAGVIAGFANYFGVNVTILRLAVVFATVATGIIPGLVTYIVATIIIPQEPKEIPTNSSDTE